MTGMPGPDLNSPLRVAGPGPLFPVYALRAEPRDRVVRLAAEYPPGDADRYDPAVQAAAEAAAQTLWGFNWPHEDPLQSLEVTKIKAASTEILRLTAPAIRMEVGPVTGQGVTIPPDINTDPDRRQWPAYVIRAAFFEPARLTLRIASSPDLDGQALVAAARAAAQALWDFAWPPDLTPAQVDVNEIELASQPVLQLKSEFPVISAITPNTHPWDALGIEITITGTRLARVRKVNVAWSGAAADCINVVAVDDQTVTCQTPAALRYAPPGPCDVTVSAAEPASWLSATLVGGFTLTP
jgi:IPT/TIG domain